MAWHRRYRMLIGIYAIALLVGIREYVVSRSQGPVDLQSEKWSEMTDVVAGINPGNPDTEFLEAIQAMQGGDEEEFVRRMEEALASGVKHNDLMMRAYTQHLLNTGGDYRLINFAANRWRDNHPFSEQTIWLSLAAGPTSLPTKKKPGNLSSPLSFSLIGGGQSSNEFAGSCAALVHPLGGFPARERL